DSFDLCVQTLRDTRCDYGSGPYSLCGLFKADYVYSDAYVFNFTSQTDATEYASNPQSSTFLTLSNVPDLAYGDTYDVAIDAIYNLVDGAGNNVTVVCENDEPCTLTISDSPTISMATEDNTVNAGPQFLGNYIQSNTYVCGAASYTWEFTRTDSPELPIEYNTGSASTLLRISDALTASAAGGVFDVRVKPEYSNGAVTTYGSIEELTIIGVVTEPIAIVANETTQDEDKADNVAPSALIYPNPSTGDLVNLNINDIASDVEVVIVNIYDNMGRIVMSEQITVSDAAVKQQMNLDLTSGMYNVNIIMNGKVITETLVIQK
ncbi:MAG: T9SS type A sorting domain-containing protein, partial [Flavobacteriales bacterium]